MAFIDKIKQIVSSFLTTQDSHYITTEDGLLLEIIDLNFVDKKKTTLGLWTEKIKINDIWADKNKTADVVWSEKPKITTVWDDKIKTP